MTEQGTGPASKVLSGASNNPIAGAINLTERFKSMLKQNPLESRYFALGDWGQSPWHVQEIVSYAALRFERKSSDPVKSEDAQRVKLEAMQIMATMENRYSDLVKANGENFEAALKLNDDMRFIDNIFNFVEAQVNGLVTKQTSLKAASDDLNAAYAEEIKIYGIWDRIKKYVPFADFGVGAAAGVFIAWQTKMLDAFVQLLQIGAAHLHSSRELDALINPLIEGVVKFAGIFGLAGITHWFDIKTFKRKREMEEHYKQEHKDIMVDERETRRKILALIKEKALELSAKYGYLLELEMEDPELAKLTAERDFAQIREIYRARVKKILGDVPEHLLDAAVTDSNSSDLTLAVGPQIAVATSQQGKNLHA